MWKGQIHIPGSGETCMILSSFFSVQKKKEEKEKRILWSRRWVGRAWWSKSASSLETSVKHLDVSHDHRRLNLSPESFCSNSGCVCPWMLTGSRGSCSRGDICRSYLTANSFMPFSICIYESKLCSSEDEKYLKPNCALLQRSHTQEMVWPQQILSHTSSTFHPIIQGGRLTRASYLWEKWRSLSSRGISFQSNVQHLKPTDTSSPFLSPFSRHVLVIFIINSAITPIWLRDYASCSCWNLSFTCTLAHSHTHAHIS